MVLGASVPPFLLHKGACVSHKIKQPIGRKISAYQKEKLKSKRKEVHCKCGLVHGELLPKSPFCSTLPAITYTANGSNA